VNTGARTVSWTRNRRDLIAKGDYNVLKFPCAFNVNLFYEFDEVELLG